jgi:hypothetical protein
VQNLTDEINQTSFQATLNEIEEIKTTREQKLEEKNSTEENLGGLNEE